MLSEVNKKKRMSWASSRTLPSVRINGLLDAAGYAEFYKKASTFRPVRPDGKKTAGVPGRHPRLQYCITKAALWGGGVWHTLRDLWEDLRRRGLDVPQACKVDTMASG